MLLAPLQKMKRFTNKSAVLDFPENALKLINKIVSLSNW
jgi:hypothetical protein